MIGDSAFYNATKITSVILPSTLVTIGDRAFFSCTFLTNITMPNVTSIGSQAFYYCLSLANVAIPSTVTNMGANPFDICHNLSSITVDPANPRYSSANGALFDKSQSSLIRCPEAQAGTFTIPDGIISIGAAAFDSCRGLTNIGIPASLASIGNYAFDNCDNLLSIVVNSSNLNYSSKDGILYDKKQIRLKRCPGGKTGSYSVPDTTTAIDTSAFYSCSRLTSIMFPCSITNIGSVAFSYCSGLTGLFFPTNAPSVASDAFPSASQAKVYYLAGTKGWGTTFGGLPTFLWNPQMQTGSALFGVLSNRFGFNIIGPPNVAIVIEACTNLTVPTWTQLQSGTLTNGTFYFSDGQWTNFRSRYYHVRAP